MADSFEEKEFLLKMDISREALARASPQFVDLLEAKSAKIAENADKRGEPLDINIGDLIYDIPAFTLLMSIIHQESKVAQIDAGMMLRICVLVDQYSFKLPKPSCADLWFDTLKPQMSVQPPRDLEKWIFIAQMFRQEEAFKNLTRLALRGYTYLTHTAAFPLGPSIRKKINRLRSRALFNCISSLRELYSGYLDGTLDVECAHEGGNCDITILGEPITGFETLDLSSSILNRNHSFYRSVTVDSLLTKIRTAIVEPYCYAKGELVSQETLKQCGYNTKIKAIMEILEQETEGMCLPED